MLALYMLIGCNGDQKQFDEQSDAAYAAGCDEGRIAGTAVGLADGKDCRERSDVPLDAASKGMLEYCGDVANPDDQPCYSWEIGYLDCWRAGYDMSYPVAWDTAGCDADSGS